MASFLLLRRAPLPADFQNGQAARAVIGQPSFSARDGAFAVHALTVSHGRLNAADTNRLLTFDLTDIPGPKDHLSTSSATACAVCGFAPLTSVYQTVIPGIAATAVFGRTVVVADPSTRRVIDLACHRRQFRHWTQTARRNSRQQRCFIPRIGEHLRLAGFCCLRWQTPVCRRCRAAPCFGLEFDSPASDDQPADAVLGEPDFSSFALSETPGSASLHTPSAIVSDGANLFMAIAQTIGF